MIDAKLRYWYLYHQLLVPQLYSGSDRSRRTRTHPGRQPTTNEIYDGACSVDVVDCRVCLFDAVVVAVANWVVVTPGILLEAGVAAK